MESLDELSKTSSGKPGFFKHVFNFDEDSKAEMLNLVQYIVLALVPVIILNKLMQRYVPEADDDKSSLEITAEVLAQVLFMFFGILIINRIITYVPTYSGEKYPTWNVISAVLPMLVILISLQTKLGEKISILFERIMELWEGPKDTKGKKGNGNVKVSQPISQNQIAMNQSLNSMGSTSISALPPAQPTMTQQLPNYDQMYQQDSTPLVGAASPGMEGFEPLPANGGGMGAFGSAFGGGW
jgi:uncharacterized protein with PQ loop repeat